LEKGMSGGGFAIVGPPPKKAVAQLRRGNRGRSSIRARYNSGQF
jgi:hypothetical protein